MLVRSSCLAVALCALSLAGSAQQPPARAVSGTALYVVRGFAFGDEMPPWDAELAVADTTVGGKPALRARYDSRKNGDRFLFSHSATWQQDGGPVTLEWRNGGRVASECTLTQSGRRIAGTMDGKAIGTDLGDARIAMADFALGAWLAQRALVEGDTVRVWVVRCGAQFANNIEVRDTRLVVRSATAARGAGAEEPAWLAEEVGGAGMKVWVARSDRRVLRTHTPQGTVGHSLDILMGVRP